MTVSASCHNAGELDRAIHSGANFALLSPVFPTASHPEEPPLEVTRFVQLAKGVSLPVVALGGITPENRAELSGYGVAVISAILDADDPKLAARQLHESSTPS